MENMLSTILRSGKWDEYPLSVKHALFSALDINARNPDSVLNTLLMSSLMNSYVEGRASFMRLCGQTVRNNLREQDPDALLQLNDEIINKLICSPRSSVGGSAYRFRLHSSHFTHILALSQRDTPVVIGHIHHYATTFRALSTSQAQWLSRFEPFVNT